MSPKQSIVITVKGVVQGVGFRPYVYKLATHTHLYGNVSNTGEGVIIQLEGSVENIDLFMTELRKNPPSLARIDHITIREQQRQDFLGFEILESLHNVKTTSVSPDVAVCEECLSEMKNPHDRRAGYYLINCT